jgi:hypothetical protein
MNKMYDAIHRYDFLTKELLEKEYVTNGLTDKAIAAKYNMPSKVVVWRKRKGFGIENKLPGKSNKNACKNRKYHISKIEAQFLLDSGKSYKEISEKMGCSVLVARRRFEEMGLTKKQDHTSHFEYYNVDLTESQKQLLIGSALGDGDITRHKAYGCTHSAKQKEYFMHKMDRLSSIHSGRFQKTEGLDPQGKLTYGLRFTTGTNKFIETLRPIFYPFGKKIFPYEFILENLKEEGLAYWFMDDGSTYYRDRVDNPHPHLHTEGFMKDDCKKICILLSTKFDIHASIVSRNRRRIKDNELSYTISILKSSSKKLFDLIRPYVLPMFFYKIDYSAWLKYREAKAEAKAKAQESEVASLVTPCQISGG